MIIDTLENLEKYTSLNPLFQTVVDFIKSTDLNALSDGKHQILGNNVFVNVQTLKGKKKEEAPIEYHRQMVDIQIPLSGKETYGISPLADLPKATFSEENDCALIHNLPCLSYVTAHPGMFVVFFPQDAHAPGITEEHELHKLIFKVKA